MQVFTELLNGSAANDERRLVLQEDLPIAISPSSVLWNEQNGALDELAREYVTRQLESDERIFKALKAIVTTMDGLEASGVQVPPQIVGRLGQPDGSPAARVQVSLELAGASTADARLASVITSEDGSFVLSVPTSARTAAAGASTLVVTGATGVQRLAGALEDLQPSGVLPQVTLTSPAEPLSMATIAALQSVIDAGVGVVAPGAHALPALSVGEDECEIVFRKDTSSDRFPWGMLFRLTDPTLSEQSLLMSFPDPRAQDGLAQLSVYGQTSPAVHLAGGIEKLRFRLAERVSVDQPISVDAFRDRLVAPKLLGGIPVAGSLAVGYVVRMAQRWTPLGLALGDLVYSLPLAPGEEQQIAVTERTATSIVSESEQVDSAEQLSFAEQDDTSATATFASAFNEVASGGSQFDSRASSFSAAAAVGAGGVFPFGCLAGGLATSFGTSAASGSTNTWMSGARDSTSDAAQLTHSSVERQAAARRSSSRTAMRLASATETDQVVTKTIANHNKTRALTMQYWEVQRLFDVTTVAEGVTLVCMVPLEVVRFLPAGQPSRLVAAPSTPDAVLARYAQLLSHVDILDRVVPGRYRHGLSLIADFAADPTMAVADASAPAEDILHISLTGTFLPFDEVSITVLGTRGMRVGPVRFTGMSKVTLPTGTDAYASEDELFGALRGARGDVTNAAVTSDWIADVTLPPSLARQDVIGFEITRRTNQLDYHFAPQAIVDLGFAKDVLGPLGDLESALQSALSQPSVSRSYASDRLERELGGPQVSAFSADIPASGTSATVSLASTSFGGGATLPTSAYPIAALSVPPVLSYASILEIEKTLQWVMRNTMTCSVAVFASLTPEERAVMLERYEIQLPPTKNGTPRPVPLLSCVQNNVLGYYGNSMVLPFIIPAEITEATTVWGKDQNGKPIVVKPGITTAQIQDALTRFHTDGFDPPRSTIALPTNGVLGEAVLGHCPSAEKIDLTRFWNWQDSPGDAAPEISPVEMPSGSLTAGLEAPNTLTGLAPLITNFNTSPVAADTSLATGLAQQAASQPGFDVNALTNAGNLTQLTGATLGVAESARSDALKSATDIATAAIEAAASISTGTTGNAGTGSGGSTPAPGAGPATGTGPGASTGGTGTSTGGTGTGGTGTGTGGTGTGDGSVDADVRPTLHQVFFDVNSSTISASEEAKLDEFIPLISGADVKEVDVRGFTSPEGSEQQNADLSIARRDAVMHKLEEAGIYPTPAGGGWTGDGPPGDYPRMRRADINVTYWPMTSS